MTLEEKAVKLLTEKKLKIALAESCTGGLLAKKNYRCRRLVKGV
jgi:nicotinamide mononucleotide (NMN) deamidase PncC